MPTATIKIGIKTERLIPISPQSQARIRVMLPKVFTTEELTGLRDAFAKEEFDVSDIGGTILKLTAKAYGILVVLAPAIETAMPEHEWQGFGSAEALAQGDEAYDEELDNSPTYDQIIEALETALKVNGMSRLGQLLGSANDVSSMFGGPSGPPTSGPPTTPTSPG